MLRVVQGRRGQRVRPRDHARARVADGGSHRDPHRQRGQPLRWQQHLGQASASRHFLRRYGVLKRRVLVGECKLVKVADTENPANCLTKWVLMAKLRKPIEYMENSRAHVA
jgi:hypothetical protein